MTDGLSLKNTCFRNCNRLQYLINEEYKYEKNIKFFNRKKFELHLKVYLQETSFFILILSIKYYCKYHFIWNIHWFIIEHQFIYDGAGIRYIVCLQLINTLFEIHVNKSNLEFPIINFCFYILFILLIDLHNLDNSVELETVFTDNEQRRIFSFFNQLM